ncbi:MAG TPA: hypothetical protein VLM11_17800 [Streptosporangiaceae bacterium]|nr:hypothetical protein [Streptosporangiaceae bacterium]
MAGAAKGRHQERFRQAAGQVQHAQARGPRAAAAGSWRPYWSLATSYLFSAAYESAESGADLARG